MKRLWMMLLIAAVLVFAGSRSRAAEVAPPPGPRVITYKPQDLVEVKNRIKAGSAVETKSLAVLVEEAEKALGAKTFSVVNKPNTPPSGDKHDYMSLSPYWWPDPSKPNGLPYIRRDGETNHERDQYDQPVLDDFTTTTFTLALAYYYTGDEKYAEKATQLMRAWFFEPETRMNPNCRWAQVVRGREDQVKASGVLETDRFRRILDAEALMADYKGWTSEDHEKLKEWIRQLHDYILTSPMGKEESIQKNNHGTWYAVQAAAYEMYLGDDDAAKKRIETEGKARIRSQIEPDGKQPFELERTKAFDYSRYNLAALMTLAGLGDRYDINLWSYQTEDGRSIRKALDWLAPYAVGDQKWDRAQIVNPKIEEMFTLFRRAAIQYHEPKYEELAEKVPQQDPQANRTNLLFPKP